MTSGARDVLLVVDVQNDFLPGGALPVPDGDGVIGAANQLGRIFPHVLLTQDWHPAGHISFASSHPSRVPFSTIGLSYGDQVLWPDHCIQGTEGASFADGLDLPQAELIIRKGFHSHADSYSAFLEADRETTTGLGGYLRQRGFERVFLCGLATDYCVAFTAIDASTAGFEAVVIEDACRGIDLNGSLDAAWASMAQAGVRRMAVAAFG